MRIICTIPESTFLEPVHTNIFYISTVVGVMSCLVIVASVVIGKLGTKRINVFASISKEIARGNFTKAVPFTDGDEIGQLGRAFNTMSASIQQRIEQLRAINNVVLEVHAHVDLELLLQDVANAARRLINAEMSVLILLDEQGEKVKYFKVSMPKPCAMKDQPEGKGLLGVVAKKGLVIRLANMKEDMRSAGLPADHPPIHTLLGIPIKIDDKPIGGVFLANKAGNGGFTLEDEELLLTLAYQAAVAIENARLLEATHRLAITDGLTGLLNHREFHRRLADYLKGSERYHYAVSFLMIDIDHFKQFNDTYGHQIGDQVLKTVGDTI
ncbi:MAG: diguanylate cyclase, partial [Planctomycetota bacterium]|nr:diguanylate cyclase [Planctomycetota bacterium]